MSSPSMAIGSRWEASSFQGFDEFAGLRAKLSAKPPSQDVTTGEIAPPVANKAEAEAVASRVRQRITALLKDATSEGEAIPAAESIVGLYSFLVRCPSSRMPLVGLDDDGCLVATWRKTQDAMLTLRFLDRKNVEFAIAAEAKPGKISRDWGETTWVDLMASGTSLSQFLNT
jgi:hypothetical protein